MQIHPRRRKIKSLKFKKKSVINRSRIVPSLDQKIRFEILANYRYIGRYLVRNREIICVELNTKLSKAYFRITFSLCCYLNTDHVLLIKTVYQLKNVVRKLILKHTPTTPASLSHIATRSFSWPRWVNWAVILLQKWIAEIWS